MKAAGLITIAALTVLAGCRRQEDRLRDELAEAAGEGRIYTVKALVEAGADVNARGGIRSSTSLMEASRGGHLEIVKYLLELEAEVNARSGISFTTPLMEAAAAGHGEIVERLLSAGARLDLRGAPVNIDHGGRITYRGKTAFLLAVAGGHIETARKLKTAGADVGLRDENGYSAVEVALRAGRKEMARELIRWGLER